MFSGCDGIACGRVDYDNAVPGGSVHIDIVRAYSGSTDHLEFLSRFNEVCPHLGLAAHNQGIVVTDYSFELLRLQLSLDIDLSVAAQDLYSFLSNLVCDKNLHLMVNLSSHAAALYLTPPVRI